MTPGTRCLTDEERDLVERHLPLVQQVLSRVTAHYPRHADREELAQAARLGLVEAAIRYDDERGVPFGSWAAVRVRGAILDAVRALDFAPRTLRSAERDLLVAREELLVRLGRLATDEEVATHLGIPPARLVRLQARVHRSRLLSLDASYGSDGGQPVTLATGLVDDHLQPLEALEEREHARYVRDALACLPPRLQDVLVASFLDGEPLSDIARRIGVTDSRVSQMRAEALALVRDAVSAQYGDARVGGAAGRSARRRDAYAAAVGRRSTFGTRLTGRVPLQRVG